MIALDRTSLSTSWNVVKGRVTAVKSSRSRRQGFRQPVVMKAGFWPA